MGANQTTFGAPWNIRASDRTNDILVTFTHSNPAVASTPAQLELTALHLSREFEVEALTAGVDTIVASAPGFSPDTVVLTVTSPRFAPMNQAPVMWHFGSSGIAVGVGDTTGIQHGPRTPIGVWAESSDSSILVPSATTLPAKWRGIFGLPMVLRDTGVATVTMRDSAGVIPPSVVLARVALSPWMRVTANDNGELSAIGAGQRFGTQVYVLTRPFSVPEDLDVQVTSTNMNALSLSTTLLLAKGQNNVQIPMPVPSGMGTARIVVSAKGFAPDTSVEIQVGVPRFQVIRYPTAINLGAVDTVVVRLTDQRGRGRVTDSPITVSLAVVGAGLAATQATVPAGAFESPKIPVSFTRGGALQLVASWVEGGPVVYASDTVIVRVAAGGRSVAFASNAVTLGIGQRLEVNATREGFSAGEEVAFALASLRSRATVPGTVSFSGSSSNQPVLLVGAQAGVDTLSIAATGYAGDSLRVVVTEGQLRLGGLPASGVAGTAYTVTLTTRDSTGATRPVHVATQFAIGTSEGLTLTTPDGTHLTSITVPAGASASEPFVVKATSAGQREIVVSRPGYVQLRAMLVVSQ